MKPSIRQLAPKEKLTQLRRAVEGLAPFCVHRAGCAAYRRDGSACDCGLSERLNAAQQLCRPNNPPPTYTPRKYG